MYVCGKSVPPKKKDLGQISFQRTKSGAGGQLLLKDCKAEVRVKGVFVSRTLASVRWSFSAAALRTSTNILHLYWFASIRILSSRGEVQKKHRQLPRTWGISACELSVCRMAASTTCMPPDLLGGGGVGPGPLGRPPPPPAGGLVPRGEAPDLSHLLDLRPVQHVADPQLHEQCLWVVINSGGWKCAIIGAMVGVSKLSLGWFCLSKTCWQNIEKAKAKPSEKPWNAYDCTPTTAWWMHVTRLCCYDMIRYGMLWYVMLRKNIHNVIAWCTMMPYL